MSSTLGGLPAKRSLDSWLPGILISLARMIWMSWREVCAAAMRVAVFYDLSDKSD
jgi:hypothetical protein